MGQGEKRFTVIVVQKVLGLKHKKLKFSSRNRSDCIRFFHLEQILDSPEPNQFQNERYFNLSKLQLVEFILISFPFTYSLYFKTYCLSTMRKPVLWSIQAIVLVAFATGNVIQGTDDVDSSNPSFVGTTGPGVLINGKLLVMLVVFLTQPATSGNDEIILKGGDDRFIQGRGGNDTILGGNGSEWVIQGGDGNDNIYTGAGNDEEIYGGVGDDVLNTGDSDDTL